MDSGGKDGVINRVFQGVNPQGVRVAHFKEPTLEELDYGFLVARTQTKCPERGLRKAAQPQLRAHANDCQEAQP